MELPFLEFPVRPRIRHQVRGLQHPQRRVLRIRHDAPPRLQLLPPPAGVTAVGFGDGGREPPFVAEGRIAEEDGCEDADEEEREQQPLARAAAFSWRRGWRHCGHGDLFSAGCGSAGFRRWPGSKSQKPRSTPGVLPATLRLTLPPPSLPSWPME